LEKGFVNLMVDRFLKLSFHLLVMTLLGSPAVLAQHEDPHRLYEEHCAGCHARHAGVFVQSSLSRADQEVVGRRSGKGLRSFLAAGHGNLAPRDVDVVVAHLVSVLDGGGLFREKCLMCHSRAVGLARGRLILSDGKLVGRYTGRDIEAFMENHGRLEGAEVSTIVRMLQRQLATEPAE